MEFLKNIIDSVDKKMAAHLGITVHEYRKRLHSEVDEHWCKCNPQGDEAIYCGDKQQRNEHCVIKHHWHCGKCGKLVQVG